MPNALCTFNNNDCQKLWKQGFVFKLWEKPWATWFQSVSAFQGLLGTFGGRSNLSKSSWLCTIFPGSSRIEMWTQKGWLAGEGRKKGGKGQQKARKRQKKAKKKKLSKADDILGNSLVCSIHYVAFPAYVLKYQHWECSLLENQHRYADISA